MGHSQATKRANHGRIVEVASERFRERGIDGTGVADLLAEAGLTHGAFYRHFGSRDDLVGEGVEEALRAGGEAMERVANTPDDPLRAVIAAYLSPAHRDQLATSCAVATLAGDVARSTDAARTAYTRQVERYIELRRDCPRSPTCRRRGPGRSGCSPPSSERSRWRAPSTTRDCRTSSCRRPQGS